MKLSRYPFAAWLWPSQLTRAVRRGFRSGTAGNLSISRLAGALLAAIALIMTYPAAASAAQARHSVTEASKLAAAAGNYGAWAFSDGDMPSSVSYGFGATQGQAEVAALGACEDAGGGSGGSGDCYARAWFENAFSSFAYDASGAHWGESWASSSARADSLALGYCADQGAASDCAIVARTQTANPTGVAGGLIQATPSYGVWAISPSTKVASWGTGDTVQGAQQAAIPNCEAAGGKASECSVYGAWVENGYSAIYMGANGSWSVSVAGSPAHATNLAQDECQTVKAVGLTCTLKGSGVTSDPWVAQNLGWIKQPSSSSTVISVPVYTQFQNLKSSGEDCGPTSVAMVLQKYGKFPSGDNSPAKRISAVRTVIADDPNASDVPIGSPFPNTTGATGAAEFEYALKGYGASYTELPEPLSVADVTTAIEQGHPVIAFLNAKDLTGNYGPRGYSGHWLVVKGFEVSSGVTYVVVNDPDSDWWHTLTGSSDGSDQKIPLSVFEAAANGYSGFTTTAALVVTG